MGEMSEMMLGMSASDMFVRDLRHVVRGERLEEDPDNPKYMDEVRYYNSMAENWYQTHKKR
jgi:hypothetical protein